MTLHLTQQAKRYLAERKAEAVRIITSGAEFTESQRRTAWAFLTGWQPHMRHRGPQPVVAEWPGSDGPSAA